LEAWTGPLLYEISPAAMQEQKLLAPARLTLLEVNFPEDNYNLLWKDAQRVLIFEHEDRNRAIADAAIKRAKEGKKVFLFAGNNLAYAHRLHDLIAEDYPGVELATGRMPTWHNQEALRDLGRGVVSIVISTVIFDEGINLPELNVVILANAGRSYVKLMQRVGRGLRLKEGGGELEVIDFLDLTNRFLKRHSNARLATYIEEGIFGDVQVQRI
jgi:superfamily II DNA or RNA helicase